MSKVSKHLIPTQCKMFNVLVQYLCAQTISIIIVSIPLSLDSMFPTFQLSISGCGICFDPSLLQFIRQLPLEAYSGSSNASTDITHTHEAIQLSELEAPPTPGAPSLAADEVQDASSNKLNLLSIMKGYATKVRQKNYIKKEPSLPLKSTKTVHTKGIFHLIIAPQ